MWAAHPSLYGTLVQRQTQGRENLEANVTHRRRRMALQYVGKRSRHRREKKTEQIDEDDEEEEGTRASPGASRETRERASHRNRRSNS